MHVLDSGLLKCLKTCFFLRVPITETFEIFSWFHRTRHITPLSNSDRCPSCLPNDSIQGFPPTILIKHRYILPFADSVVERWIFTRELIKALYKTWQYNKRMLKWIVMMTLYNMLWKLGMTLWMICIVWLRWSGVLGVAREYESSGKVGVGVALSLKMSMTYPLFFSWWKWLTN